MLRWAIMFLVISIIAAILGFYTLAGVAGDAAKLLALVFLVVFVVSLIMGGRAPRDTV